MTTAASARSSFGFNTNIWLSRNYQRVSASELVRAGTSAPAATKAAAPLTGGTAQSSEPKGVLRVAGQASLFAQDQDMKVWTSHSNPTQSIGFMECSGLG